MYFQWNDPSTALTMPFNRLWRLTVRTMPSAAATDGLLKTA